MEGSVYRTAQWNLKLDQRRVIEAALHLNSQHSQLKQTADLVAWESVRLAQPPPRNHLA